MDRTFLHISIGLALGFVLSFSTVLIALYMGWVDQINLLELFAVATSYTCTYLCAVQVRWQYIFAAVTTVAYTILFYQWGLYGSAIASAYVPIALVYGWFRWGRDDATREVTATPIHHYPLYLLLGGVGWYATHFIASAMGITVPVMDSAILVLTIMAQFMMDNKKLENWIVWAVLNVIAIYLYFNTGLILAGMQYILFLANTVFAFVLWKRAMREPIVEQFYGRNVYVNGKA